MNYFSICTILGGLIALSTGLFVYHKNKENIVYVRYFIFSLSVALWSLGYFLFTSTSYKDVAILGYWVHNIAIFIPATHLHFVLTLIGIAGKRKKGIIACYTFSFLLFLLTFTPFYIKDLIPKGIFHFYVEPRIGYYLFAIHFTVWVIYAFYHLFVAIHKSKTYKATQLKYFTGASLIGFIGGGEVFLYTFNILIPPYGLILFALYPLVITYAIVRHHLMDVQIAFKRTMAYSISAGLLTGLFIVLVLLITNFLSLFINVDSFEVSIFAALVIALLFTPLRNRVQNLVDKLFYKKTYDYYSTIQRVSHELATNFDLKKIYSFIGDTILSTLGLRQIYLISAVHGGDYEVVYHTSYKKNGQKGTRVEYENGESVIKTIDRYSDIVKFFNKYKDIVIKDELSGMDKLGQELIKIIKDNLEPFQGEAIVPVFVDDKLSLLMILGDKLSGDMFTFEDINLLNTISNQTAIAIKNARLYKEKVNSEKLASIGMMSATFAHEIRNPLTSLKTFAQLMPEKYNDTEFRDIFSKIVVGEIKRIDKLIKGLLDFSTKKRYSGIDNFNITALISETVDYIKDRLNLEEKNIVIEKCFKDIEIDMTGDANKLKQAFTNIINNGCQAIDGEGVLKVDIVPNGKNVDIAITDTGRGMSPAEISRIFDPFYTTKDMGIGLGLAISKQIIEDHGGRIKVESKLSQGTTFIVSLPVQDYDK